MSLVYKDDEGLPLWWKLSHLRSLLRDLDRVDEYQESPPRRESSLRWDAGTGTLRPSLRSLLRDLDLNDEDLESPPRRESSPRWGAGAGTPRPSLRSLLRDLDLTDEDQESSSRRESSLWWDAATGAGTLCSMADRGPDVNVGAGTLCSRGCAAASAVAAARAAQPVHCRFLILQCCEMCIRHPATDTPYAALGFRRTLQYVSPT